MIACDSIEDLIAAARAVAAQHPGALDRLQAALKNIDEGEADAHAHSETIAVAREEYVSDSDGDIEIDEHPLICPAHSGVWVNAWVWVAD